MSAHFFQVVKASILILWTVLLLAIPQPATVVSHSALPVPTSPDGSFIR